MAKKSKQQKKLADYRRRIRILEARKGREALILELPEKEEPKKEVVKKSPVKIEETKLSAIDRENLEVNARYIARDLKKTLIFSAIGIGIILTIYFYQGIF